MLYVKELTRRDEITFNVSKPYRDLPTGTGRMNKGKFLMLQ